MKDIQSSLWKRFDRLRSKIKSYEVVLYLLILHKEDLFGCLYEFHPELGPDETFSGIISKYPGKKREALEQGFDEYKREIHSMDLEDLKSIELSFNELLDDIKFEALFETILFTLIKNRDYEKGEYVLPDEISELIVGLADIKNVVVGVVRTVILYLLVWFKPPALQGRRLAPVFCYAACCIYFCTGGNPSIEECPRRVL